MSCVDIVTSLPQDCLGNCLGIGDYYIIVMCSGLFRTDACPNDLTDSDKRTDETIANKVQSTTDCMHGSF